MYDQITEADVHRLVAEVRRQFPGFQGRVPLRVAQPPKDLMTGQVPGVGGHGRTVDGQEVLINAVPTAEWQGRTCPVCRKPFAVLDHWERRRNGPHVHRRCVAPAGQIAVWIPRDVLSSWLYRAGATYAGPTITPNTEIEFCCGDLPGNFSAAVASSNRGLLYRPDGSMVQANATIGGDR